MRERSRGNCRPHRHDPRRFRFKRERAIGDKLTHDPLDNRAAFFCTTHKMNAHRLGNLKFGNGTNACDEDRMSVLRMEPVWMATGQIAGLAAAEAKAGNFDVAAIDPHPLPGKLRLNVDPWESGLVTLTP